MLKRQLGNHRGVSIVEFALVLPLVLAFMGFTVDFGLAFFVSHITQNAAREGARLAATIDDLADGSSGRERVDGRIKGLLPAINLFRGFEHTMELSTNPNDPTDCQVTVTVSGTSPYFFLPAFLASIPSSGVTAGKTIAIERTVSMRYESACPT